MLYFRKLLVARKFMDKREGEYHDFPSKIFCLTVPEKFVGDPSVLCFRKLPVTKSFWIRRGGVARFSVEFFLCHSAEKFRRGTVLCSVSVNSW